MVWRLDYIVRMSYDNDLQYQCFDIGDISFCCDRGLGAILVEIQVKLRLFLYYDR